MGAEYEILYFVLEEGNKHYCYADSLGEAIYEMERCRKDTNSECIILMWRP